MPRPRALLRPLLALLSLLLAVHARACLNTPGIDLAGRDTSGGFDHFHMLRETMLLTDLSEARPRPAKAPAGEARQLEARALHLLFARHYSPAVPLLEEADRIAPGDYSIAANLGTAYELVGRDADALHWITESMRRNPDSHQGTEWIHVLVLEAKLRAAADPAPPHRPLVELPSHFESGTPLRIAGVERPAAEVRDAIAYQLGERMLFVKPTDPWVAELLFALARLNANLVNVDSGANLLGLALEYGFSDSVRLEAFRADLRQAEWLSRLRSLVGWSTVLATAGGIIWFFRHRRRRRSRRA